MSDLPLPSNASWSPKRVLAAGLTVGGVVLGFAGLYVLRNVLFLLFVAIVLATALKPLVSRLERRGARHAPAVVGVYAVLAVVLIGVVVLGGPPLADQAASMTAGLPQVYADLRQRLAEIDQPLVERLVSHLPQRLPSAEVPQKVMEQAVQRASQTLDYVGAGLRGLLAAVAVVLLSFYWSLQEERTVRWLLLLLPAAHRDSARELLQTMEAKVGAYVRGQGLLCVLVGLMSLAAFLLIGLPYAVVLALLFGLMEAVPFFGPILGAIPALLTAAATSPGKVLAVLVAAVVIQQVENYLLVPRVMGKSVGVSPIVTLLAIAGFAALLGLPGAILAIPMAAVIQLLLDRYVLSPEALEPPEPEGRDAISVLRYEARELVQDIRLRAREKLDPATPASDQVEEVIEAIARDLDRGLAEEAGRIAGRETPGHAEDMT